MTLREVIHAGAVRLRSNADLADSAARDAEFLLQEALAIPRATLLAHPDREIDAGELARYMASIERRGTNEPIQYITGQQEFYGLRLHVTPAVLIPRPETEHLVEAVLRLLRTDRPLRILDVGTGSGAIAIALAAHLPRAEIDAVDLSGAALAVAAGNARMHGVDRRIRFLVSDLLSAVAGERYDTIVSNPPYIPESDRAALHPQVRDFEPAQALFAGAAGLDIYRRLIPQAQAALRPGGLLAMEIGFGQREVIQKLLEGWSAVSFVDDLRGIARVVLARLA